METNWDYVQAQKQSIIIPASNSPGPKTYVSIHFLRIGAGYDAHDGHVRARRIKGSQHGEARVLIFSSPV
jgi:hypothetical protein